MKEEPFELNTFIGGWYIPKKICKDLITLFENNPKRQTPGQSGNEVRPEVKESTDIPLWNSDTSLDVYNTHLQKCIELYTKKYPETNDGMGRYNNSVEQCNIQKYLPNQGYKKWHWERCNLQSSTRLLVYMTYLNDVKNGGTEFKYQNIKTKAKQGLTLIWPSDFTHTHRGIIAKDTKYIITGWFSLIS